MVLNRFDTVPRQQELQQVLPLPVQELMAMNQPLIQEWNNRRDQIGNIQAMRGQLNSLSAIDNAREDEEISQIIQPILNNVEQNPDYLKSQNFQTDLARQINNFNYTGFQNRRQTRQQLQARQDQLQQLQAQGRYNPLVHGTQDELSTWNSDNGNIFVDQPLNPYVSIEEEFDPILGKVEADTWTTEENGRIYRHTNRDLNKLNQQAQNYVNTLPNADPRLRYWQIEAGIVNRTDDAQTSAQKIQQQRENGSLSEYLQPRIEQVGRRYLVEAENNRQLIDYTPWVKQQASAANRRGSQKEPQGPQQTIFNDLATTLTAPRIRRQNQMTGQILMDTMRQQGLGDQEAQNQQRSLITRISNGIATPEEQSLYQNIAATQQENAAREDVVEVAGAVNFMWGNPQRTNTQEYKQQERILNQHKVSNNPEIFKAQFTDDGLNSSPQTVQLGGDEKNKVHGLYMPNSNLQTQQASGLLRLSSINLNVPSNLSNSALYPGASSIPGQSTRTVQPGDTDYYTWRDTYEATTGSVPRPDSQFRVRRSDINDTFQQKLSEYIGSGSNYMIRPGDITDYQGIGSDFSARGLNTTMQQQVFVYIPEDDFQDIIRNTNNELDNNPPEGVNKDLVPEFLWHNKRGQMEKGLTTGQSKVAEKIGNYYRVSVTTPLAPEAYPGLERVVIPATTTPERDTAELGNRILY